MQDDNTGIMKEAMIDVGIQARNSSPVLVAYSTDLAGWISIDNALRWGGLLYLALQIGYLVWKWGGEYRARKKRSTKRD